MRNRYHRQILLPEIGEEGQLKIRQAKVLIVGMGGLGCPIALCLCGAGIGLLGMIDDDMVSLCNLPRQILYDESDIGLLKVDCATRHLSKKNSDVKFITYPTRLTEENAESIIAHFDIVVDGCDNHATRYLISDVCHKQQKPYVYAAIGAYHGQVSVLCLNEHAPTYRSLFPNEETSESGQGVIGITPGIVGNIAAGEVLKLITGYGSPLVDKLVIIDLLEPYLQTIELR